MLTIVENVPKDLATPISDLFIYIIYLSFNPEGYVDSHHKVTKETRCGSLRAA